MGRAENPTKRFSLALSAHFGRIDNGRESASGGFVKFRRSEMHRVGTHQKVPESHSAALGLAVFNTKAGELIADIQNGELRFFQKVETT